jgi:hypothetical protein
MMSSKNRMKSRRIDAVGKRPVSPEEFGTTLKRLCEGLDIQVKTEGNLLSLLKVRLKSVSKTAAKAEIEA